ncbi:MAG: phosphotransferase family protein [Rhodobacteraceae bacterium]|nr:MAG: phosphotransferase family protein [Paracoccaceae bacterium]|tara:strand:+ start:328 stop:1359 length:1032 start_codon:yes stop_codon:yes gene_type:complete
MITQDPIYLDLKKVTKAITLRMPEKQGPWVVTKTPLGQSNPTFILNGRNEKLVLRKKPLGTLLKSAHMVEREYKVMSALAKTDVPVPEMYYLCEDAIEIGTPYFVMEYIDGQSFVDPRITQISVPERQVVYEENVKGLANLHNVDPNIVGLSHFGKSGSYFSRQFSRWSRQYEASKTDNILPMEILMQWLSEHMPAEEGPSRLVHGDWRIDNLLFHKKHFKLIAIIDWELSTLGDPRADLASQIMQWSMPVGEEGRGLAGVNRRDLGIPEDNEFLDQYSRYVGLADIPDLEFPIAFCYFRMAAILQGVKKRALDGNASNPEKAIKMGEYVVKFAKKALERLKI